MWGIFNVNFWMKKTVQNPPTSSFTVLFVRFGQMLIITNEPLIIIA